MTEQLKLTFHPSFHPSLDLTLKMEKDIGVVSYRVYDPKNPLMCAPFTAGIDIFTLAVREKTIGIYKRFKRIS